MAQLSEQQASRLLNTPFEESSADQRLAYRKQSRRFAALIIVGGLLAFLLTVVIAGIWNDNHLSLGHSVSLSSRADIGPFLPIIAIGGSLYGIYRLLRNEHYAENLARQDFVAQHPELGHAYDTLRQRQDQTAQHQLRPYGILLLVLTIIGIAIFLTYATAQMLANR